ncbi:MAG: DUF3943 domain-containing protein [Muribaculaceae bacterium]|nr:DUF3943 domain-containing protein [Muribaculaceae bacterium]
MIKRAAISLILSFAAAGAVKAAAGEPVSCFDMVAVEETEVAFIPVPDAENLLAEASISTDYLAEIDHSADKHTPVSLYSLPYSWTTKSPDWHRLWLNTAVYAGAMVGTLGVLECLPEDATSWNRAEIREVPMFKRWYQNVFKKGPQWDTDSWIFNYVMHPYAGAVYFMSARSAGFNFGQSMLYSALISTVFWEFGIEAFMERPSIQDIFITPGVGSLIGEGFYRLKRQLVANDYRLAGSKVLGNVVGFLIDPVNELVGVFTGNPARVEAARRHGRTSSIMPSLVKGAPGFTFSCTF